jgi:signal transduction histidine kinase
MLLIRRLELDGDLEAAGRIRDIAEALREVSGELRVPSLADLGAGAALEWLVARLGRITGDEIVLERLDPERPPSPVELAVFRVAQEALANAARHGRPPVRVRYEATHEKVQLDVEDAGPGLDPAAAQRAARAGRFGLLAMSQRAEQIGGRLVITERDQGGTSVHLEWPARGFA